MSKFNKSAKNSRTFTTAHQTRPTLEILEARNLPATLNLLWIAANDMQLDPMTKENWLNEATGLASVRPPEDWDNLTFRAPVGNVNGNGGSNLSPTIFTTVVRFNKVTLENDYEGGVEFAAGAKLYDRVSVGSGSLTVGADANIAGPIDVTGGTLTLADSTFQTSTVVRELTVTGGSVDIGAHVIVARDFIACGGGTVTLGKDSVLFSDATVDGAELIVKERAEINGHFVFDGLLTMSVPNSGLRVVGSNKTVTLRGGVIDAFLVIGEQGAAAQPTTVIDNPEPLVVKRAVTFFGPTTWIGEGEIQMTTNGNFGIDSGGIFDITTGGTISKTDDGLVFVIEGGILKKTAPTTTVVNESIENRGDSLNSRRGCSSSRKIPHREPLKMPTPLQGSQAAYCASTAHTPYTMDGLRATGSFTAFSMYAKRSCRPAGRSSSLSGSTGRTS